MGCGAVGGYIADLLFRAGARRLTLIDPQVLRPGNLVRHVAGEPAVGAAKVRAVTYALASTGLPTDQLVLKAEPISTPRQAVDLVSEHTLVVDATASSRASALLAFAADEVGGRLVSACLQREGAIVRVDRWPLGPGESHLPPVPESQPDGVRERGCGDLVSRTPPHAVALAASRAVQVIIDLLPGTPELPATVLEVLATQPDAPYDKVGFVSANDHARTP